MVYVRHVKGGSISFLRDGKMIRLVQGQEADVPRRVYEAHASRFEIIEAPQDRALAPATRAAPIGEVPHQAPIVRAQETTQMRTSDKVVARYVARHKGFGKWQVWDTIDHRSVGEPTTKEEAHGMAERQNQ